MPESYPLNVGDEALTALSMLRNEEKFSDLPGYNTGDEQARCSSCVNELLDRLIAGLMS